MPVGNQANEAVVDNAMSQNALNLRNVMTQIRQTYTFVSSMGGATWLQSIGFSSADATTAMTLLGYQNNLAAIYFGTGTQASASNFDQALSVLWAGQ